MGVNRYLCENSFGAIKKFLGIEIGHFVAIFLHFWAFLVTLMAVATTVLLTLGTGRTKRLVRHMGWWYRTIFYTFEPYSHGWRVSKMAHSLLRWKSGRYDRRVPGQGINLETILCAISPLNTWDSMTLDHFWPPQPYIHGWRGSEMAYF